MCIRFLAELCLVNGVMNGVVVLRPGQIHSHQKRIAVMAKSKKGSDDYEEEEEEDDEMDEEEEDYVPSPRDRKSGSQAKGKSTSIEPAVAVGGKEAAEPDGQLVLIEVRLPCTLTSPEDIG
jgi:hypothetical protein